MGNSSGFEQRKWEALRKTNQAYQTEPQHLATDKCFRQSVGLAFVDDLGERQVGDEGRLMFHAVTNARFGEDTVTLPQREVAVYGLGVGFLEDESAHHGVIAVCQCPRMLAPGLRMSGCWR